MEFSLGGAMFGLFLGIALANPIAYFTPKLSPKGEKKMDKWGFIAIIGICMIACGLIAPLLS